jgi:hypothetical protein
MAEDYLRSHYKKESKKPVDVPFPIEQLRERFQITIYRAGSYENVMIVNCYDFQTEETIRDNFDAYMLSIVKERRQLN